MFGQGWTVMTFPNLCIRPVGLQGTPSRTAVTRSETVHITSFQQPKCLPMHYLHAFKCFPRYSQRYKCISFVSVYSRLSSGRILVDVEN